MLDKQEHSRVWSKYNTHLKGQSKKDQKEFQKKNKSEKGILAALHMIKTIVPKFLHALEFLQSSCSLTQKEKWYSEQKMIERFGEQTFWMHVESGRLPWRDDPWTPGVWEYRDNGDITKETKVKKGKEYRAGQEYVPDDKYEEAWSEFYGYDTQWDLHEWQCKGKGKGKFLTKGSKGSLTKGKGKGKGQQGKSLLALKDKEDDQEDQEEEEEEEDPMEEWKGILSKAKRARDQSTSHLADCQAALVLADKAKRLTKTGKAESEELMKTMNKKTNTLKDLLAKKDKWGSLTKAKALLVEVAKEMKKVKDEAKELNQLANKTTSKASKK